MAFGMPYRCQEARRRIAWTAVFTTRSNASGSMTSMVSPVM